MTRTFNSVKDTVCIAINPLWLPILTLALLVGATLYLSHLSILAYGFITITAFLMMLLMLYQRFHILADDCIDRLIAAQHITRKDVIAARSYMTYNSVIRAKALRRNARKRQALPLQYRQEPHNDKS